jgi:hypothetical protein
MVRLISLGLHSARVINALPASPRALTPFNTSPVDATPAQLTVLKREMTGLMEVNVPPTLCPNHDAVFDVFSPSQRSPCPSLLNIGVYLILKEKLIKVIEGILRTMSCGIP